LQLWGEPSNFLLVELGAPDCLLIITLHLG